MVPLPLLRPALLFWRKVAELIRRAACAKACSAMSNGSTPPFVEELLSEEDVLSAFRNLAPSCSTPDDTARSAAPWRDVRGAPFRGEGKSPNIKSYFKEASRRTAFM